MGYSPWDRKRVRHDLVMKQEEQQLLYNVVLAATVQHESAVSHVYPLLFSLPPTS